MYALNLMTLITATADHDLWALAISGRDGLGPSGDGGEQSIDGKKFGFGFSGDA